MRVAIINSFGFESGGMTTLCIQYSKLGLDVYIKDVVHDLKYKTLIGNVHTYSNDSELVTISRNYDRLIFLPPAYKSDFKTGKYLNAFLPIVKLRTQNPNIQLCYLYCSRDKKDFLEYLLPTLRTLEFDFDYYYSISTEIQDLLPNILCFDINAFQFDDLPDICEEHTNVVLTAGRIEGFKGIVKYLNHVPIDDSKFMYVHEGAGFTFNKTGSVSVPMQLMQMKLDNRFVFKRYEDQPEVNVINIYPTYKLTDIQSRWITYFAGICCIMGTENKYVQSKSLFDNSWRVINNKEQTLVSKQAKLWGVRGLEYANLEMINLGLPVLFSRGYGELLQFDDSRLLYSRFSEIPAILEKLTDLWYYKTCRNAQRSFFVNKQSTINKRIIEVFTGEDYENII